MASKKKTNFGKKRKKKHAVADPGEIGDGFTLQNVVELGGDEVGSSFYQYVQRNA